VLAAYAAFPEPYLFTLDGFSVQSVVSKLRDAVRGKLALDYPCTVPNDDLFAWWRQVIVRPDGDKVYIGPKPAKNAEPVAPTDRGTSRNPYHFRTLEPRFAQMFAELLNAGHIQGPITIVKPGPDPDISGLFNVDLIHLPDGRLQII